MSTPTEDGAVVAALATETDDEQAPLRDGDATSLMLRTATALGQASRPVNEAPEIAHARDTVRPQIFDGDSFPQMRRGWARVNADTLPAAFRLALA